MFTRIILLISIASTAGFSQWSWINPIINTRNIYYLQFFDNKNGVALGEKGNYSKTYDGGSSWHASNISHRHDFVDGKFFGNGSAIIKTFVFDGWGLYSELLITTNDGENWDVCEMPESGVVLEFCANNPNNIWTGFRIGGGCIVRGYVLYQSSDNGITWNTILNPLISNPGAMLVLDDTTVIVECFNIRSSWNDYLIKTSDGGLTWSEKYSIFGKPLNKLKKINDEIILGIGYGGRIIKSSDNGETWIDISVSHDLYLRDAIHHQNNLYIYGDSADSYYIYKSTDVGNTWQNLYWGSEKINTIASKPNGEIWVAGNQGKLFKSKDYGSSWVLTSTFVQNNFNNVYFCDRKNGLITGEKGVIYRTTNYGKSWGSIQFPYDDDLTSSIFRDKNVVLVASSHGKIFKTTDAGNTWQIKFHDQGKVLKQISIINQNTLIAVGDSGVMLTSNDFGETWFHMNQSIFASQRFTGISIPSSDFISVGFGKYLYLSRDSAKTWNVCYTMPTYLGNEISSFFYINSDIGYVMTRNSYYGYEYQKTTNGGITWENTYISFESDGSKPSKIIFLDSLNGLILGNNLVTTSNGGKSWSVDNRFYGKDFFMVDNDFGCIVGNYGSIIMKGHRNFQEPDPIIPTTFYLYQNYPNPFNQGTNFMIDIDKESYVKLKVYNILGEEVASVVDQHLSPQRYIINWQPTNLSSGVYYYHLMKDNIRSLKSMLLIK